MEENPSPGEENPNSDAQPSKMSTARKILAIAFSVVVVACLAVIIDSFLGNPIRNPITGNGNAANSSIHLLDNTAKCTGAGGTCRSSCSASAASFFSSALVNPIFRKIAEIFIPQNSVSTQAGVIGETMNQIGSYPDYCTSDKPECCSQASGGITATTTTVPVNSSQSNGLLGCNNSCLELGHSVGLCWTGSQNNFTCLNPIYPNQAGTKLSVPPFADWCVPLAPDPSTGKAIACCCYD